MTGTVLLYSGIVLGLYGLAVGVFGILCWRAPEAPAFWDDTPWPEDASDLFDPANDRGPALRARKVRDERPTLFPRRNPA